MSTTTCLAAVLHGGVIDKLGELEGRKRDQLSWTGLVFLCTHLWIIDKRRDIGSDLGLPASALDQLPNDENDDKHGGREAVLCGQRQA